VFIDVAASVALYRRLGDASAARRIGATLKVVRQQVASRGGELIKRSGDELLVLFDNPNHAIDALIDIQNGARLDLRIGAHRGAVLRQRGDVYGDTVNLAARLTAIARARQIVLSRPLFESLDHAQRRRCKRFERLRIKGIETPVPIYQLCWEGGAATAINTLDATQFPPPSALVLELVLGDELGTKKATMLRIAGGDDALIGRDPSCDLVIDHPRVSRFHATVESHDGQFLLRDHSTNGSVIRANSQTGGRPLRRAAAPLHGQGAVGFGHTDATCAGIPHVTFMVA
jgi:adenylate cyclase